MITPESDTRVTRPDLLQALIPKPSNCTCKYDEPDAGCQVHALGVELKYETVEHDYANDPVSIVCILDGNTLLWHVFEGTVDIKSHSFKIVVPITAFPANRRDVERMPDQVFRFIMACAKAKGVPVYIP